MRFAVESWAPEYGSALAGNGLEPSDADVDLDVEVAAGRWRPVQPQAVAAARQVRFVDGVRRIDARVWITGDDGVPRPGVAASYAAGVVCCDGAARIERCEVRRGVFAAGAGLDRITTRHAVYEPLPTKADSDEALTLGLQERMGKLEAWVASRADAADLLVTDGPLRQLLAQPKAVGYIKSHRSSYLPAEQANVVGALAPGERTPLFLLSTSWSRFSWYARLPGPPSGHPWTGVIRAEASGDTTVAEAAGLADLATATLPRFASHAYKDPRAPQNLYPIAQLERTLRHQLGDPRLMERTLRMAARG